MYEDLTKIANLRFFRDRESISEETRKRTQDLERGYSAMLSASGIVASGPHEAAIFRSQIQGSVELIRHYSKIWVELITKRNGRLSPNDIPFLTKELDDLARIQKGHLTKALRTRRMRGGANSLRQEADRDLNGAIARAVRDLNIMVREADAFPVKVDSRKGQGLTAVHVHIENSKVGNLNLGSQVGAINTALEAFSSQGPKFSEFAEALKVLTETSLSQNSLTDLEKREIVEALSTVAEEAAKEPEKRSNGTLKAILMWLPSAISSAADLATLWDKYGSAIRAFLGI